MALLRPRDCVLLLLLPGIIALSVQFDAQRARSPLKTFTINGPHHFYSPFAKRPAIIDQKQLNHLGDIRPTQTTQQDEDTEETPVQGTETNEFRPLWQWIQNHHHNAGNQPSHGILANHLHHRFTTTETVISTVVVYVADQALQDTYTIYVPTTSYIVQGGHHHTHTVTATTTRTSVINAGVTITEAEQLSGGEAVLHVDTVTRTRTVTSVTTSTRTINAGVTITEVEQLSGGEAVLHVDTTTVTVPTTKTLLLPTTTVIVSQLPPVTHTRTDTVYVPKTTIVKETVTGSTQVPSTLTRTSTVFVPKTSTVFVPTTRTVISVDADWTTTSTVTLATATKTVSEIVLKTTYLPTTVTVTEHEGEDNGGEGNGHGGPHHPHSTPYWPRPTKTVTKTKTKTRTIALATFTSYVPDETWTVTSTDYHAPTVYIPGLTTVAGPPKTVTVSVARTTVVSTSTATVRIPITLTKSCSPPSGGGHYPPGGGHGQGGHGGSYHPGGEDGPVWPPSYLSHYPWPDHDNHHHTVTLTVPEACNPTSTHYLTTTLTATRSPTATKTITVSAHHHPDPDDHEHYTKTATATVTKTKTDTLTVPSVKTETLYVPTTTTEIVEGFETVTLPASTVTVDHPTTTTKTVTRWETKEPHHHSSSHHHPTVTVTVMPSEEHNHHTSGHHHSTVTVTRPLTVTLTTPTTVTKTQTKLVTSTRIAVASVTKTVYHTNHATTVTYYPDPHPHPQPHPHPRPPCNLGVIESALTSLEHLVVKIQTLVIRLTENPQHHPQCGAPAGNLEAILLSLGQLMDALKKVLEQNCSSTEVTERPPPRPRPPNKPCGHKPPHGGQGGCHGSHLNVQVLASLTTSLEDLIESVSGIVHTYEQDGHHGHHGQYGNSGKHEDDLRKQLELVSNLQALFASHDVTEKFSDDISEDQVSSLLAQPLEKIGSLKILMSHPETMAKKPLVLITKLEQLVDDLNKVRSLVNATERVGYDYTNLKADDSASSVANSKVVQTDKDAPSKDGEESLSVLGQNETQQQDGSKPKPTNFLIEKENENRNSTTPVSKTQNISTPNEATKVSGSVVKNSVNVKSVPQEVVLSNEGKKTVVPQETKSSVLGALKAAAPTLPATTRKIRKSKISSDKWS